MKTLFILIEFIAGLVLIFSFMSFGLLLIIWKFDHRLHDKVITFLKHDPT